MVIELDGSQYFENDGMNYDRERTSVLESHGLTVIRYSNADINARFSAVCEDIDRQIKAKVSK